MSHSLSFASLFYELDLYINIPVMIVISDILVYKENFLPNCTLWHRRFFFSGKSETVRSSKYGRLFLFPYSCESGHDHHIIGS